MLLITVVGLPLRVVELLRGAQERGRAVDPLMRIVKDREVKRESQLLERVDRFLFFFWR